jgi:3-oxoacyl-[acyl-carrier-protein] synthase-3
VRAGLVRAAVWLPKGHLSAAQIAEQSGLPEEVVRHKLGIVRKCRAEAQEHPSDMAFYAASEVLAGLDPQSIDLLLWTGSEYKDYSVWSAGIHLQQRLGLTRAWSLDIAARCSSNVVGLKLASTLMAADHGLNRILLCGGHRTGDLVNYADPATRFLYSLADGGSALLLERNGPNPILDSAVITDGSFSLDVVLPAGGTRCPKPQLPEHHFLQVGDIGAMRKRLADLSIANFLEVIRRAAGPRPLDYLALLHIKRSAHDQILAELSLSPERSMYLDHFGHFGAPDQVVSLAAAERGGLLENGHTVVLASAGIGYTWSALSLRWEQPLFANYDAIGVHLEGT